MSTLFDGYRSNYGEVVQDSIGFSGLKHDFFMAAKAHYLSRLVRERGLRGDGRTVAALDVGCGTGTLHPHLDGLFDSLAGCDISAGSIASARELRPGLDYRSYEPPRLPHADGAFDLAFAVCVLHHVPPADWPGFVAEMRRVVRPGGIVAIVEHNPFNPLTRLAVYRCPFDEDATLLSARRTASLLGAAGMTDVRTDHILLLPSAAGMARRVERLFEKLPLGAQYASSARV